jgi:hypothetical protein
MKFLLDTSFLVSAMEFKIDILYGLMRFGKPELFTLESVVSELKKISSGNGKDAKNASLALVFVEKSVGVIEDVDPGLTTDERIIKVAESEGFIVCTQDFELKRKLKNIGIPVVIIRQKKYLSMG